MVRAVLPVSWMKGADILVRTVYFRFLTVLSLLTSTRNLRVMLDARRNYEHVSKDELVLIVLTFSTALLALCLQCLKVIWPTVLMGECHNAISKIVANERRMLVGIRRLALLFIVNLVWTAYNVYLVRITVWLRVLLVVNHTVTGSENSVVWK